MSPKSKSQKRNERARKAQKNAKNPEAPKQQSHDHKLISEMKRQMEDMQSKVRSFDAMKAAYMSMSGVNGKPAAASDPPLLDEKYVKTPSKAEVALAQLKDALDGALVTKDAGKHLSGPPSNSLKMLEEALKEKNPETHIKIDVFHGAHRRALHAMGIPPVMKDSAWGYSKEIVKAGLKGKSLFVWMAVNWSTNTSSSGSAQAPVYRIRPSDGPEFTYLTNLFDEYKCVEAEAHFLTGQSGNTTFWLGAMAYDPQISGAYSSVEAVIIAEQHHGPYAGATYNGSPNPMTATGMRNFKVKMPSGPQYEYGAVTTVGTGSWTDTSITAVDYGYFKSYLQSPGGANTTSEKMMMRMGVLFRCRT